MYRLQDTYYTKQVLDGVPSDIGIKQPSPVFTQGEDVKLFFYLNYNGKPYEPSLGVLEGFLKKIPQAANVLWTPKLNEGIFKANETPGYYYLLLPAEVSAYFLPGTYYLDLV